MHYHTWKDNAAGEKRAFKVEGEFYQQVEIDIHNGDYEKLNVPSIMNMLRAEIVHDFHRVCIISFSDSSNMLIVNYSTATSTFQVGH